jgi:hypothetical protein
MKGSRRFLRETDGTKKMIAPICRGKMAVAMSGLGLWRDDQSVIVSSNLISSRNPDDVAFFSKTMRDWLQSAGAIKK